MRYLGGKSKIAKRLAMVIGGGNILVEPFIGGGAMTAVLAPLFKKVFSSDVHPDLILMWQALKDGWDPPRYVSEDEYKEIRNSPPSPLRGLIGFSAWGGKWFGGYARGGGRNYADETARALVRDIKLMGNVHFKRCDYRDIAIPTGAVVYADPPYEGTTGYNTSFDTAAFWLVMNRWVEEGASVFVSEFKAPPDWTCIERFERTRDIRPNLLDATKVTECLFHKGENVGSL